MLLSEIPTLSAEHIYINLNMNFLTKNIHSNVYNLASSPFLVDYDKA